MRWEIEAPSGVFFALGMGAAIHNGELSPVDNDHKALGSRVLFHPSAELGYRFDGVNSVSIFADHVSNGFTQRYNEGLDTIGIRYGRRLGPIAAPETNGWEPVLPVAVFSGLYVGAFVGYQIETVDWFTASPIRSSRSGFAEGGYAGYSWQSGKGIFGIEVDASPARRNFSAGCDVGGVYCVTQVSGVYSARARFGWVIDNGMIYGTAGVALTPWDASVLNAASQRLDQATGLNAGVAVGAGLEYKLGASLARPRRSPAQRNVRMGPRSPHRRPHLQPVPKHHRPRRHLLVFPLAGRSDRPSSPVASAVASLNYFDEAACFPSSFMHFDRKCLRAFPCRPFASACLEHSIDPALRALFGFAGFCCTWASAVPPNATSATALSTIIDARIFQLHWQRATPCNGPQCSHQPFNRLLHSL